MLKALYDKYKNLFKEMILYGIFGLFSASMDTLSFMMLSKIGLSLLAANFISVNIGIAISFLLNTFLNFKKSSKLGQRALKFFGVGYMGLALSTFIMWYGVTIMHQKQIIIKVISVVIVAAVQYLLNKFITFRK
ncbi:GtrA family protein [Lachnospiraceae bacterium 47-T17]